MESAGVEGDVEFVKSVMQKQIGPKGEKIDDAICEQIAKTARGAVAYDMSVASELPLWASKIGGIPYLPLDAEYPKHKTCHNKLGFLCQINFSEIDPTYLPDPFPRSGILQWYINDDECYGNGSTEPDKDQEEFRVLFWPDVIKDEAKLTPRKKLTKIVRKSRRNFPLEWPEQEYTLTFRKAISYISPDDSRWTKMINFPEELFNIVESGLYKLRNRSDLGGNYLGGWPDLLQRDPRMDFPDQQFELLIQLCSSDFVDWHEGVANLFIEPAKLKECDFSHVIYDWACA